MLIQKQHTLINTPLPFWNKWKINYLWCPDTYDNYCMFLMCLNFRTPKLINFPFGTNGKLINFGDLILKIITACFSRTGRR